MTLWATFDCYGTLVDWIHAVKTLLEYLTGDSYSLHRFFSCERREVAKPPYRPYRVILATCLEETLHYYNMPAKEEYREALITSFAKSPLFPDTVPGLIALRRRGIKTAIISNTERGLIGITLAGIKHLFDAIVTAEDTKAYKPNPQAIQRALELIGADPRKTVHISAYPYYDLQPAARLGLKTILVNRYGYQWRPSAKNLEEVAQTAARILLGGNQ